MAALPDERDAAEDAAGEMLADGCWLVRLVEEHSAELYRYAFRLTGRDADAEDLTQQTFLIARQKMHQLRESQKARSWLFTVLRRCFLKSRRRPAAVCAASLELNVDEIPENIPDAGEIDQEELQAALNDLPDEYRIVVAMFYFEEMSYKQIAEELDVPIGTIMSRLSRAKGRLRRRLLLPENGVRDDNSVSAAGSPAPPPGEMNRSPEEHPPSPRLP